MSYCIVTKLSMHVFDATDTTAKVRGTAGIALITASFALTGLGSQPLLQLTFQSYIVECVRMDERSPAFARLGRYYSQAAEPDPDPALIAFVCRERDICRLSCFSLGERWYHRFFIVRSSVAGQAQPLEISCMLCPVSIPLLPFWIGTGVFATMFLYAICILPEALTEKRREELMQANGDLHNYASPSGAASPTADCPTSSDDTSYVAFFKRINFVKKLAIFLPTVQEGSNRRDYRLFLLAVAFTIYRIGSMYLNDVRIWRGPISF